MFTQRTINRIPQRRPIRMFPLPGDLVGNDKLSCLAENVFPDGFHWAFSGSQDSSEVLEIRILRLGRRLLAHSVK